MTHNDAKRSLWVLCMLSFGLLWSQLGHTALTVSPTRAVFEGNTRSMQLKLTNDSDKAVTYRITFKNMRMTEEGTYEDIDSAKVQGQYAERMVRFSPRQITLDAGASQSVRLLVRKPKDLAEGEYRSHLLFQEVPDQAGLDLTNVLQPNQEGIGVVLVPISGVSIPVIVRQGKLNAEANLTDLGFKPGNKETPPSVEFNMNRTGSKSVHGDLEITHFAPGATEGVIVGMAQSVSVLAPTNKRKTTLELNVPPKHQLKGGRLVVVYRNAAGGDNDQQEILAQAELPLS